MEECVQQQLMTTASELSQDRDKNKRTHSIIHNENMRQGWDKKHQAVNHEIKAM